MITIDDFLSAFFPDVQEPIRLRFFPPRGAGGEAVKYGVNREVMHGDEDVKAYIRQMNQTHGVYFVVNSGGDKDAEISRYNAWFVEGDDQTIEEQHKALDEGPLQPSIRVETKKSVHAYWLIASNECSEQEWRDIQARLIAYYKGDPKNKNPSRVMRLPYLNHLRVADDGSLPKQKITLPYFAPELIYSKSQIQAVYPPAHHTAVEMRYSTGQYSTWDALNAEARRRILSQPGCKIHGEWAKCKGICHDGKSDTGLAVNVASGAYFCQGDCDTPHVLRSLGLPENPDMPAYAVKLQEKEKQQSKVETEPTSQGIYTVDDLSERIDLLYEKGLTRGESPGWPTLENLYTVKKGQFTVLTGVPGSGKTQVLDNIMVNLARDKGWRFAVCSLENQPLEQHAATLLEIKTQEPFSPGPTPRMSVQTRDEAKAWLNKHFTFLLPTENDCTITGLLDLADKVRQKHGLDGLVIDPWNEFEHRRPAMMTETQYTSDILSRIRRFGRTHEIHTWLVAHPTKLTRDKDGKYPIPTLYDISGSSHFRNKCDMGLVAWRDSNEPKSATVIYVQKVRFRWCGQLGSMELHFDPVTGCYYEYPIYRTPNVYIGSSNGNGRAKEQEYA